MCLAKRGVISFDLLGSYVIYSQVPQLTCFSKSKWVGEPDPPKMCDWQKEVFCRLISGAAIKLTAETPVPITQL